MALKLGDAFPNLDCKTTKGDFKLYDYFGDSWGILFSHPKDYTPVCTTELGAAQMKVKEFDKLNTKLIGLSIDPVADHHGWTKDILAWNKMDLDGCTDLSFPLMAGDRQMACNLGMLDPDEIDKKGLPLTARCVFIIGPDKKVKLSILYPATTGRNFNEIVRVTKSLQLTANHKVATPANWQEGEKCMVVPSISDEDAMKKFGDYEKSALPSGKGYIRMTAMPKNK